MIINIRGTNGSGKTTLARALIGPNAGPVDLVWYDDPTKKDPIRRSAVEGWGVPGRFLAVGSYKQGCGGMDTIPNFALQQAAVVAALDMTLAPPRHVICEGVLASTVAGSWLTFFQEQQFNVDFDKTDRRVLVAYMDTPLELCLERIKERQRASGRGERDIKVELVKDKIKSIQATRAKMQAAGISTVLLRHDHAEQDLLNILEERSHGGGRPSPPSPAELRGNY